MFGGAAFSTGLPGLDQVFQGLRPGDNIVWQVDSVADYIPFVHPFCRWANQREKRLIYFRFAKHEPLIPADVNAEVHQLKPEAGFELFITRVHEVIQGVGDHACYVFDAISELSLDQYSDRMLGNFYMVTCPYLYALNAVAYYALLKNYHSYHASSPIAETTQILVDVYRRKNRLYAHPRKVKHRYSPTMHLLHVWENTEFRPVTESMEVADVLTSAAWSGITAAERPGVWTRTFLEAEEIQAAHQRREISAVKVEETFRHCLRMAVTRDEKALVLAEKYLDLAEVLDVRKRMLSSGLIGGKTVGMLLARAILRQSHPRWKDLLEPHDSFYVGSEAFYTFLVHNHCWRLRQKQKNPETFLQGVEEARQRLLTGVFPEYLKERFANMLDYFGPSPIIVRSSSLLEDNFGNAFAGKYDSVFCANQGPRHIRLDALLAAVRTVYASSMSEEALLYRAERGVLEKDEQMALLIQRVSGVQYGRFFFPHAAGVAFSYNPYVWSPEIDPHAGMVRLVFGLGTRAVDRTDDDYTRVVALNEPLRRPEADFNEVRQFAQRRVDVLDLSANILDARDFSELVQDCPELPLDVFAVKDEDAARLAAERGYAASAALIPTFQGLLAETSFPSDMRLMLQTLQSAYQRPVDVEFTLNFTKNGEYKINLLQCRPLQCKGNLSIAPPSLDFVRSEDVLFETRGAIIGPSRLSRIDRFIYISPAAYGRLTAADRYEVAQIVGRLTHAGNAKKSLKLMLLGPGRWGTSTPALGVPVSFRDIRPASVICEIVAMNEDLVPDVSLGTHFFSDLIESDILYLAFFPHRSGNRLSVDFFEKGPNKLSTLLPGAEKWEETIRVVDAQDAVPGGSVLIYADVLEQRCLCYAQA